MKRSALLVDKPRTIQGLGLLAAAAAVCHPAAQQGAVGRAVAVRIGRGMGIAQRVLGGAVGLWLVAVLPAVVRGGVSDTSLPTFSDGQPAVLAAVITGVVKNNEVESAVMCTNLAVVSVDVGLEVFDHAGVRGNTIAAGNGALLAVAPGRTVTLASGRTAVLHEDAVITLEAPVTGLRNGSARVVATSGQLGCVAFAVDRLHTITDLAVCPTCPPPTLAALPVSAACPTSCDDGDPCTDDGCDPTGGCVHTNRCPVPTATPSTQLCGDADGSGTITVTDGVLTLRAAAELSTSCTVEVCDVDGSGGISVTDGVNVLRAAAGLPATLTCGR